MLSELIKRIVPRRNVLPTAVQYGHIGVEFGLHRWRLLQVCRRGSDLHLSAFSSLTYDSSREELLSDREGLRKLVAKTLRKQGFKGRDVVSCMPAEQVRITMLHYTISSSQDDAEVILQRMSSRIEGDLADHVVDYVPIRTDVGEGQEKAALVALARRDDVIAYLDFLRGIGLNSVALEIGPVAIRRLVSSWNSIEHDNVLIVTMGQDSTYMTVLHGRRLIFDREVKFGEKSLIERLCNELDIDSAQAYRMLGKRGLRLDDHAGDLDRSVDDSSSTTIFEVLKPLFISLVGDINKALIYTASETRGRPVSAIHLNGAVARWNGVSELLSQLVSVPVTILDPMRGFSGESDLTINDPRAGVVAGMAMRGLFEDA